MQPPALRPKTPRPTSTLIVSLLLLLAAGCGSDDDAGDSEISDASDSADGADATEAILASDYDQRCAFDHACALVSEGDPCACHVCPDAALSADALEAFTADWQAASCQPLECPAIGCGERLLPACVAGACTIREEQLVRASDFAQTCVEDADCALIYEGEVCASCPECRNAAISASALAGYEAAFQAPGCTPGPCAADCANVEAFCDAGVCATRAP